MNSNDKDLCFTTCSIIIFGIGFIISIITFIIFLIIGLINTSLKETYDLCNESHLWIYGIVSLLLILKIKNTINIFIKDDYNTTYTRIEILINIVMFFWGIFEFFNIKCINNLNNTILYKTTLIYWIIVNIILFGLFFKFYICYKKNINTNDIENINTKLINF